MRPQATNLCPTCNKPLTLFRHPKVPSIPLDSCPHCLGVWVDEGELSEIHKALQPAPQQAPPPPPAEDPTATKDLPIVRGYHLSNVHHARDWLDQILRGLTFIVSAFRLLKENPQFILPILLNIALGFALLVLLGLGVWAMSGFAVGIELNRWLETGQVLLIAAAVIWYLATVTLGFFFKGAVVSMVDAYLKGRPVSLSIAFRDALKNADRLLALALFNILIGWLSSMLSNRRGTLWLGDIIRTITEVVTYLLLPIIIVEDTGLVAAVKRGIELYRRHLLPIAAGEVGVRLVSNILNFFAVTGVVFVVALLAPFGILPLAIGASISAIFAAIVWSVNAFITTAYHTCLYLWAVEYERAIAPEQVTVPAPLAAALV
ncbi:MAG: zf-TFIIB domain-containing protein [Armatimonadetes bacterium]|nr:zf-TFIIB domain-containing protein [Armatimonadota bacterium]MDW8028134.1 zf-TFIIB domain-containing protein [Armatimonadota bacterium]